MASPSSSQKWVAMIVILSSLTLLRRRRRSLYVMARDSPPCSLSRTRGRRHAGVCSPRVATGYSGPKHVYHPASSASRAPRVQYPPGSPAYPGPPRPLPALSVALFRFLRTAVASASMDPAAAGASAGSVKAESIAATAVAVAPGATGSAPNPGLGISSVNTVGVANSGGVGLVDPTALLQPAGGPPSAALAVGGAAGVAAGAPGAHGAHVGAAVGSGTAGAAAGGAAGTAVVAEARPPAWQSKEDRNERMSMIQQIVFLLRKRKPDAPPE